MLACWNRDIAIPLIWASALVLFVITGAIAYVRSCRWDAVQKHGWPRVKHGVDTADLVRALGENAPKYETKVTTSGD
jgi:hypothetical protein